MTWVDPVLGYCERLAPGPGMEPMNTLTGLAFLLVGWRAVLAAPAREDRQAGFALALVGIASALHHGLAIRATLWADVLANQVYLMLLGRLMLRRLAGLRQATAALGGVAAVALVHAGAIGFAPLVALGRLGDPFMLEFLLLMALAIGLRRRHRATATTLALAAAVLALGLPFRFLDAGLCPHWPLGTHWVWHLANAGATALLLAALARHPARPAGPACEGPDARLNGAKPQGGPHGH